MNRSRGDDIAYWVSFAVLVVVGVGGLLALSFYFESSGEPAVAPVTIEKFEQLAGELRADTEELLLATARLELRLGWLNAILEGCDPAISTSLPECVELWRIATRGTP